MPTASAPARPWLLLAALGALAQAVHANTVEGRVVWDPAETSAARVKLVLTTAGSLQQYAWPTEGGHFAFHGVAPGSHLLEVAALGQIYTQYRVDVSSAGKQRVVRSEAPLQVLPKPLVLHPVRKAEYFEKRTPFDVIGFLKTPYGLMIAFGIFAIFVLPRLKVDPEEYQELVAQSQGGDARRGEQAAALPGSSSRRKDQ